jgi:hypothetical protein
MLFPSTRRGSNPLASALEIEELNKLGAKPTGNFIIDKLTDGQVIIFSADDDMVMCPYPIYSYYSDKEEDRAKTLYLFNNGVII